MEDLESKVIVQSEELGFKSMTVKCSIRSNPNKKYTVLCKAYDQEKSRLWTTELLDEHGELLAFDTKEEAWNKTKKIFSIYK